MQGERCDTEVAEDPGKAFANFDCKRVRMHQRYYGYLFNLPMNLLDGGQMSPEVTRRKIVDKEVLAVRIVYPGKKYIWDHFFDPETFAMVGCSFRTKGEEKDGEYVVFKGEVTSGDIRRPEERTWYTWAEDKLLGTDKISKFEIEPPGKTPAAQ